MTEKRYELIVQGIWDNVEDRELTWEELIDLLNKNEQLKKELFEARKDYLIETADISDKLYLDEMIEKERREIFGDVE